MKLYCVKCRQKTESKNVREGTTKNNKKILKSTCLVCESKKSTFVKNEKRGEGFTDVIGQYIGELHLPANKGENVPDGSFNNQRNYSYCGPGTKYEQRVREGYKGINELDAMCKLHDKFYTDNSDTKTRNISDVALAHRASEIANDSRYDSDQRKDANFVAMIMKNKARFGLGINSKNVKRGSAKTK